MSAVEWVEWRVGRVMCIFGQHNPSCRGRRDHCPKVGRHGGRHDRPLWSIDIYGSMTRGGKCKKCGAPA